MSYTNETTYYGLPLPTGSDKSTFPDNNTAFQAVDAALHTAYEGAATAAEDITSLKGRMSDAETDIDNLETDLGTEKGKIVALQNKETLQDGEIADVRSDCEGMVCAYNEATSTSTHAYSVGDYFIYNDVLYVATDSITVGATIVPDTNCETTDVATVLKSQAGKVGDLSDLTTTDKSSAVAAINEVKSDLVSTIEDLTFTSSQTWNTVLAQISQYIHASNVDRSKFRLKLGTLILYPMKTGNHLTFAAFNEMNTFNIISMRDTPDGTQDGFYSYSINNNTISTLHLPLTDAIGNTLVLLH